MGSAKFEKMEETFEVDRILKSRKRRGNAEYLVRWKGYGAEEDTWEPEDGLADAQEAIQEFLTSQIKSKTPSVKSSVQRTLRSTRTSTRKTTTVRNNDLVTTKTIEKTETSGDRAKILDASPIVTAKSIRGRLEFDEQGDTYKLIQRPTASYFPDINDKTMDPVPVANQGAANRDVYSFRPRDMLIILAVVCVLVLGYVMVLNQSQ